MPDSVLKELEIRGMIGQVTNEEGLREWLDEPGRKVYLGFDPSADSLHVGNLLPIMALAHMQRAGHIPIVLVGGATGMIGDPSGKSEEREFLDEEEVASNAESLKEQLSELLDFDGDNGAIMVNNVDWLSETNVIDFLREAGKHIPVNKMLSRESVKRRLDGNGMSFTEFSYMMLQGFDFWHLFKDQDCRVQIGGSDQWGNILIGVELIRKKESEEAFALTVPLITTADDSKFGKSEGNAVWLDSEKTSPFAFYQFWINTADEDVEEFLKFFTFLDVDKIEEACKKHEKAPHKRKAQKKLAEEVTRMIHGEEELKAARRATDVLFGDRDFSDLTEGDIEGIVGEVPSSEVEREKLGEVDFYDLFKNSSLCDSGSEARRLFDQNGLGLNGEKLDDLQREVEDEDLLTDSFLILQKGESSHHIVKFT